MLLHRVRFCKHVQDFALVHSLLDPVGVALFFHADNFLSLGMEHMLAPFKSCFKFLLFLAALAEFPLALMNDVLFQSNCIQLRVQLAAVNFKRICSRAVIRKNLGLVKCVVFRLLLLHCQNFLGLFFLFSFFSSRGRRLRPLFLNLSDLLNFGVPSFTGRGLRPGEICRRLHLSFF